MTLLYKRVKYELIWKHFTVIIFLNNFLSLCLFWSNSVANFTQKKLLTSCIKIGIFSQGIPDLAYFS